MGTTEGIDQKLLDDYVKKQKAKQKPRTNQEALIEKMRDVRTLAEERVWRNSYAYYGDFDGGIKVKRDKAGESKNLMMAFEKAVKREIKWLLSPAEDGK